jgi:AcrR family transcriptional regulator
MAGPSRREAQAQERRAQLLETALTLFAEKGLDATTMRDLAEGAGVAQGLVYHYFRSKEELFYAVIEQYNPLPQVRELMAGMTGRPAAEALPELAARGYELMRSKHLLLRVVLREAMTHSGVADRISTLREQGFTLLATYLEERVAAGELRPHDTAVAAISFLTPIFVLNLLGLPGEPLLSAMVENLLRGIAAPERETGTRSASDGSDGSDARGGQA